MTPSTLGDVRALLERAADCYDMEGIVERRHEDRAALRTLAAALGDDAVERVAKAMELHMDKNALTQFYIDDSEMREFATATITALLTPTGGAGR